jgi:hypothetical protein
VRPGILLLLLALSAPAWAADARVTILKRQLDSTKDPRLRSQTVLLLGRTGSPEAVEPLCSVLKDSEALVRAAAASALGDLKNADALKCLKAALGEKDASVRAALERAIKAATPAAAIGKLYVSVDPVEDKVGGLPDSVLQLADRLVREKLSGFGASFAPAGEDRKAAMALIRANGSRGYVLRVQIHPHPDGAGLKLELLVMTYPDQSLKGSWNVKAKSNAKPESLVKAMVPRVLDDAAADLEWKTP